MQRKMESGVKQVAVNAECFGAWEVWSSTTPGVK